MQHPTNDVDVELVGAPIADAPRSEVEADERIPEGVRHVRARDLQRQIPLLAGESVELGAVERAQGLERRTPLRCGGGDGPGDTGIGGDHGPAVTWECRRGDRDWTTGRDPRGARLYRPISLLMINCWISLVPSVIDASFASR